MLLHGMQLGLRSTINQLLFRLRANYTRLVKIRYTAFTSSANKLLMVSGVARNCCKKGQRLKLCYVVLVVYFGAGYSSCLMTNSSVTNAVLIERAVSCWHLHQLISQTTQYLDSWLSDLEVERGHVPQCPIAGDTTVNSNVNASINKKLTNVVHWH